MKTLEKQLDHKNKEAGGFTLPELLIIVATVAFLGVLVMPTVRHAKERAQVTKCLDNMNLLMIAAQMYTDDNKGLWFPNQPEQQDWVADPEDWTAGSQGNTNSAVLISPPGSPVAELTGCSSSFVPYIKNPLVYKCPSDPSTVGGVPRIRSYSANEAVGTCLVGVNPAGSACPYGQTGKNVTGQWLGGPGGDNDCQNSAYTYQTTAEMIHPNPANLWIFVEEHPDSINDSGFAAQIGAYQLGGVWIDLPSNLHNEAGSFSFADGHAEIHKWVGRLISTLTYVQGGNVLDINYEGAGQPSADTAADAKDLNWVQARTSYPKNLATAPGFP